MAQQQPAVFQIQDLDATAQAKAVVVVELDASSPPVPCDRLKEDPAESTIGPGLAVRAIPILRPEPESEMEPLDGNLVDLSQAKLYSKKQNVRAFLNREGALYRKSWGEQNFPGAHYLIVSPDGEIYGCAIEEFRRTYEPVPGRPETYRKSTKIRARRMPDPFTVTSRTSDGNVESARSEGRAGDWLVEQVGGDRQLIRAEDFARLYEEAPVGGE